MISYKGYKPWIRESPEDEKEFDDIIYSEDEEPDPFPFDIFNEEDDYGDESNP